MTGVLNGDRVESLVAEAREVYAEDERGTDTTNRLLLIVIELLAGIWWDTPGD